MVIVDSTVWIHYLRTPTTPIGQALGRLLETNEAAITGVVLAEVLQGARSQPDFDRLRSWMEVLPYVEASQGTWARAAELSVQLRGRGRLIPLTDLVIAALALEGDHQVFTQDEHFRMVPGLSLYEARAG